MSLHPGWGVGNQGFPEPHWKARRKILEPPGIQTPPSFSDPPIPFPMVQAKVSGEQRDDILTGPPSIPPFWEGVRVGEGGLGAYYLG